MHFSSRIREDTELTYPRSCQPCASTRPKRRRHRGKRAGVTARLKARLAYSLQRHYQLTVGHPSNCRLLEQTYQWLVPVFPEFSGLEACHRLPRLRRWSGSSEPQPTGSGISSGQLSSSDTNGFGQCLIASFYFISTPRASGRGGGLATIFRNSFWCQPLSPVAYTSFELQLFLMNPNCPGLCAVIYWPPKLNKDFIEEFSDFLANIVPKYNSILILGDF